MISVSVGTSSVGSSFLKLILIVAVIGISILPSIIAFFRTNSNRKEVYMLNIVGPIVLGLIISFMKIILPIAPFEVLFDFINKIGNFMLWIVSLVKSIKDN
ncbi:MAG: hypothetical protein IJN62_05615 [Clostridia bacterium]|nr:hypothetical protein [Clostridia bacterium]